MHSHRKRRDDKAGRCPQVFVAVDVAGVGHAHHTVVDFCIPVVAEVLHPLKVAGTFDLYGEIRVR